MRRTVQMSRLRSLAAAAAETAANLLFPWSCVACSRAGALLCDACAQAVLPMPAGGCPRCGEVLDRPGLCAVCAALPDDPLAFGRSAAIYDGPVRSAIHHLKYERRPELAPLLARYLVAALQRPEWAPHLADLNAIAPVPLHAQRMAKRGYNQAELLAQALAATTGMPLRTNLLMRSRETRPQVGLNAAERRRNVDASFHASPAVAGQTLLLIDDVFTTGATLRDCARAAHDAGAARVLGLTVARPLLVPQTGAAIHH